MSGARCRRASAPPDGARALGPLRYFPALTITLFLGPVVAGLLGTVLPAFGYLPVLGSERLTLDPWRQLVAAPGLDTALRLTLVSGLGSTLLALALTLLLFAAGHGTRFLRRARQGMTPLLAVPHLAFAVGLAFLLAPSGWLARLVSPALTGWQRPPDLALVQDPWALALLLGLALKETPFLILMTFAALGQLDADGAWRMARSLGYGPVRAWLKVVLPQLYPQLRLPLYAVLAYSLSVVDMAIVLGPTTPPTLAPLVLTWFHDPDLAMRCQAAAGACLQLLLVLAAIALWHGLAAGLGRLLRPALSSGRRGGSGRLAYGAAGLLLGLLGALAACSLLALLLWSGAGRWRFPAAWPDAWSAAAWRADLPLLAMPAWTTLVVGLASTAIALALVLGCLENESRRRQRAGAGALVLIYVPLLVPQISFLFGMQIWLLQFGLDGSWTGLIWAHLLFVLPYVFLALAEPYRSLDPRYVRTALALGQPAWRVWWRIKLVMLLRPILVAAAIGFAVSVAQYLPTVFAGAGRLPTLTTEALGLAAGGNRRIVALFGLVLALLPLMGFALAQAIPAWRFRHRAALRSGS